MLKTLPSMFRVQLQYRIPCPPREHQSSHLALPPSRSQRAQWFSVDSTIPSAASLLRSVCSCVFKRFSSGFKLDQSVSTLDSGNVLVLMSLPSFFSSSCLSIRSFRLALCNTYPCPTHSSHCCPATPPSCFRLLTSPTPQPIFPTIRLICPSLDSLDLIRRSRLDQ